MDVVRQQVTADELLHMPDDGFRYELVREELRRMTPAGNVHGRVAMSIAWRLARHVEENRLGTVYAAETGFRLATKMVLAVNPRRRSVTLYRSQSDITILSGADVLDGGDVVPDFQLTLREIFA
jgi:Uma2 family endonuclease